jgi:hypothetical protein
MEQMLHEAESTSEPFTLRLHITALSAHRQNFSKELETRFLFLCQRLREKIRSTMPAAL